MSLAPAGGVGAKPRPHPVCRQGKALRLLGALFEACIGWQRVLLYHFSRQGRLIGRAVLASRQGMCQHYKARRLALVEGVKTQPWASCVPGIGEILPVTLEGVRWDLMLQMLVWVEPHDHR